MGDFTRKRAVSRNPNTRACLQAKLAGKVGVILASECSIYSSRKLWPPSLILLAGEGRGEKEICTRGVVVGQKIRRGVGVGK